MGKIIEYTIASVDGAFDGAQLGPFGSFRDAEYMVDGLAQLQECEALLMGRTTYEQFARIWPARADPWAARMNAMPKYVFSSTLTRVDWENTTLVDQDAVDAVRAMKRDARGDLIVYGHGRLARALMERGLTDRLDLSIYPLLTGAGETLLHAGHCARFTLIGSKTYTDIVKLSYRLSTSGMQRRDRGQRAGVGAAPADDL